MENRETFESRLCYKMCPSILSVVMDAYGFSKYGHRGQVRDGGERYFEHPRRVAIILINELEIYDHEMIIAALLHDIKEDSHILSWPRIEKDFGARVLLFIKLLTKTEGVTLEEYLANLQQADEAAQILKLADRLDNVRDLKNCTLEKIKRQLDETAKHFIPWAERVNSTLSEGLTRAYCTAWDLFLKTHKPDRQE